MIELFKKVSVIVPAYNAAMTIKSTLKSLINQTYSNFEVIIVDDGSKDQTKAIVEDFCTNDNRIKYVYQENRGVSSARNLGIKNSTGTYLCFLDSDDYFDPFYLEKMINKIVKKQADVCYCGYSVVLMGNIKKKYTKFKDGDILLEAVRDIKEDVGIYFVGGEPTNHYISFVKRFELENVHFKGFMNKKELKKYYFAADLFVLPTREDIWGLVINEAMSHGLPVITTDKCIAGLELVEEAVEGFIIPTNNSAILLEKINSIISNDELRRKMSKNSLEKIKSYTIEHMAKQHFDIFESLKSNRAQK